MSEGDRAQAATTRSPGWARLVRMLDAVVLAFAVLAGLMLIGQALIVAATPLVRSAGGALRWGHEVTTYFLIGEALLAAPYALRRGEHFRVTLLSNRFSPATSRRVNLVLTVVAVAFLLLFFLYSAALAYDSFQRDVRSPTLLNTPLFIPQLALPVGALLMVFALVAQQVDALVLGNPAAPDGVAGEGAVVPPDSTRDHVG